MLEVLLTFFVMFAAKLERERDSVPHFVSKAAVPRD